jgi:hypothetical protein
MAMRTMLIEDDNDTREMMVRILKSLRYEPHAFADGASAVLGSGIRRLRTGIFSRDRGNMSINEAPFR